MTYRGSIQPDGSTRQQVHSNVSVLPVPRSAPLLEPLKNLTFAEVRSSFNRCVLCPGTLPSMLRSDRGAEFRSVFIQEYVALMGIHHRHGTAWRPVEQGIVERSHQEMQKIMGMLMCDVLSAYASEWRELLPVVEFLTYTTLLEHMVTRLGTLTGDGHWRLR